MSVLCPSGRTKHKTTETIEPSPLRMLQICLHVISDLFLSGALATIHLLPPQSMPQPDLPDPETIVTIETLRMLCSLQGIHSNLSDQNPPCNHPSWSGLSKTGKARIESFCSSLLRCNTGCFLVRHQVHSWPSKSRNTQDWIFVIWYLLLMILFQETHLRSSLNKPMVHCWTVAIGCTYDTISLNLFQREGVGALTDTLQDYETTDYIFLSLFGDRRIHFKSPAPSLD